MSEAALPFIAPDWRTERQVSAAMTLRKGGVSSGPYQSLNLGVHVGDDPESVAENRRRVSEHLALPSEPVWLEQIHGTSVVDLDLPGGAHAATDVSSGSGSVSVPSAMPRADAAVTRRAGPVCVIQVADCMPVLLAARDGSAIGAAHAGWRGLAGGVIEATARAMGTKPGELLAWLGPTIASQNFEVGEEVRAAFVDSDSAAASAFTRNERQRWQCDLYALARLRLAALGVRNISGGGWDTYADADRFFSYRRDGRCGRMAAFIWINP